MFDSKSDYALNKRDQNSIVYCGSDGYVAHITRADFSSEEEFLFWKSWSDADYKETDYADSYFHRHTVGLDTIGDNAGNIPSPEETLLYTKQSVKNRFRKPWSWFRGFQNSSQRCSSEDYGFTMSIRRMCAVSQRRKVLSTPAL